MTEDFLKYIWKFRLFSINNLYDTSGNSIEVQKVGTHNTHAGPDFFNAKIKINNTLWAGNVEVHVKSSDWKKHQHEKDEDYDNVILHVVYQADSIIYRKNGEIIPTLVLADNFNPEIYQKYLQFLQSNLWIPCQNLIPNVQPLIIEQWLDRLLVERLERKSKTILDALQQNKNDWAETFYQHLSSNFGFKTNSLPFELLAKSLQLSYLSKHKNNLMQLEAMFFGQAGFLNSIANDSYTRELQKEYKLLSQKFGLQPIDNHLWKFLRLRPCNFPTIRISQFANLIHNSSALFSKVLECKRIEEIVNLFRISTSEYWDTHYRFDTISSVKRKKHLGKHSIYAIIINTIVPFLFIYGQKRGLDSIKERALEFLEKLPPEKNSTINKWKTIGLTSKSAHKTQALLQLKKEYCHQKKCLFCTIGNQLLKNE